MAIISLVETLVKGILVTEEKFFHNPEDFYGLETSVKHAAETFSAAFIGEVLNSMKAQICENPVRKRRYITQRSDKRNIISSVGDIIFDCTYYSNR